MSDDPIKPGGALEGRLFEGFLRRLSETREPEPGDRIGAWRVVCELGRGGSGVVYMAERADGAFSQQVALKWLRGDRPVPGGREALARERELLASLDHPHIARLIDGGQTDDGMLWFAMDLADGKTIDLHAAGLALRQRLTLLAKLCRAVHHAHRRGLIHGDIKPSNVLVDGRGEPRLVDFGISRMKGGGLGSSYGLTPDYASPEQRAGDPLTTASDIWQLGHLLEDLVAGQRLAADLRSIMLRATAASPDERYTSASAMAADLEAVLEDRPVLAHAGGARYRVGRWIARNRALALVSATAVVMLLAGGAWATLQLAQERDIARAEAARAEAALAETQAVLARVEALRDFLVDLFQATRPTRPHDQLPGTEEILARGAERALDPDSAPATERLGMLVTIAQVYRSRSLYDDARPLIEAAVDLLSETPGLQPEDHAEALALKAHLMVSAGDSLDDAEALLIRAEALLDDAESPWNQRVRTRITRTWIERHRGNHQQALALLEPMQELLETPGRLTDANRAALLGSLAGLHGAVGNLEESAQLSSQSIDAYREAQGEEGQGYVVSLANSVGLQRQVGQFEEAERRAREAIALYDRIYPGPVDYRASVRRGLARVLLEAGRTEQALEELERADREYAEVFATEFESWPIHFAMRGSFMIRSQRLEDGLADLERARALMSVQEGFDDRLVATVDMLYAWAACRSGKAEHGLEVLHSISDRHLLEGNQRNLAQLAEAEASCQFAAGDADAALERVRDSLAAEDPPGNLLPSADRRSLKAAILMALDRPDQAEEVLQTARSRFLELGLSNHPRLSALGSE